MYKSSILTLTSSLCLLLLVSTSCRSSRAFSLTNNINVVGITTPLARTTTRLQQVRWDPQTTDDSLVEFPTALQRKELTKEAKRRQAWKTMAQFSLVPEESFGGNVSSETMSTLAELLNQQELIEIRAFCVGNKKAVYDTALVLAYELEMEMQKIVSVVSYKGQSAVFYSPRMIGDDLATASNNSNLPSPIELRTSVGLKSTWEKRTKQQRDHRGQIVKQE